MSRRWMPVLLLGLWACAGDGSDEATPAGGARPPASTAPSGDAPARNAFVLCPALEEHREELAKIVGFEQDAERPIAISKYECSVDGDFGAFARVTLAPAAEPSIAFHVRGFDAAVDAAPELGPDAVFVDVNLQPHVVFAMGKRIVDVDASNVEAPSRETMIELATRVREILQDANP